MTNYPDRANKIVHRLALFTMIIFFFSEDLRKTFVGNLAIAVDDLKIKYFALLLSCVLLFFLKKTAVFSKKIFFPEVKYFCFIFISFLITTIYKQIEVGFHLESINEFLYLLVPFIFVLLIVRADDTIAPIIIEDCFKLTVFCYLATTLSTIVENGASVSDINISTSTSPFENELSPYFVYFEVYYLYKKDKKKALLCVILSFLSLKRLCLLKAVLFYIIFSYTNFKTINKKLYVLSVLFFILIPFILTAFYSGYGVSILENITGREIDDLLMSRYSLNNYLLTSSHFKNFGLGSTIAFLNEWELGSIAGSLHCDILRIYIEGTFITTLIYTIYYFKMVKNYNLYTFLIIIHLFSEGLFNHWMLGAGITCQWILIYLCIYTINRQNNSLYNAYTH